MRFSVIIPSYNKAAAIGHAIESVLNQTFQDFELIVVDNNSTDGSMAILRKIQSNKFICYQEPQQGVSYARNTGWNKANGEYICFLDADDTYEPQNLEKLNQLIELYPNAGIYANRYKMVAMDGSTKMQSINAAWLNGNQYVLNNFFEAFVAKQLPVNTNTVCVSKRLLTKHLGFDPRLTVGEDIDLWARLFVDAPVIIGDYIGSTYYLNSENRSIEKLHLQSYQLLLKKFDDLFKFHPNLKPHKHAFDAFIGYMVFGIAFACIKAGNTVDAKRWLADTRLLAYPKKKSIALLQVMKHLPNSINQLILTWLRKVGKLNV